MLITTVKYTTRGASTLNENEIFSLIFSSIHVNSTLDFLRTLSEASLARSLSLSVNEHRGNSQSVGGPIWFSPWSTLLLRFVKNISATEASQIVNPPVWLG